MSPSETIWDRYGDPRVKEWFLMPSFYPTLLLCIVYVIVVKKIGPSFMKHRKPFNLRSTMIVHNLIQILFNAWLLRGLLHSGWLTKFNLRCEPWKSVQDGSFEIVEIHYWFYILKLTEFFDAIIFVLRKKSNQVTTLHLLYHGVMPISGKNWSSRKTWNLF